MALNQQGPQIHHLVTFASSFCHFIYAYCDPGDHRHQSVLEVRAFAITSIFPRRLSDVDFFSSLLDRPNAFFFVLIWLIIAGSCFFEYFMTVHRLGIVVEGGGIRGIYAAGVLDVLSDLHLPVKGVIGVSAGAIHGCSFVAGQKGRSLRFYKRFITDDRFFSFKSLIKTGNLVDTEFCYHDIPYIYDPFDNNAFMQSGIDFYVTCTNVETGQAEYLLLSDMNKEVDGLRASASLPYVSQIVQFRGKKLLDGGCSDRIPLKAFERLGFDRNIVISTQPREHKVKDRDAYLAKLFYRKYPQFCRVFANSPITYERTQQDIDQAVNDKTAFVIRPKVSLGIKRLTHSPQDVQKGYDAGRRDALALLPALQKWMTKHC